MVEGLPLAYFVGVPLRVSSVNKEFDVVIIGDCNPDIVLSGPDVTPEFDQHEKLVPNAAVTIGGSGSITACACARIGLRTRFVGAVGDDLFGQFMIGRLHDWGVDTTLCPVLKGEATGFSVILNNDVDRAILTYPGTIGRLGREHLPLEDLVTARHVHVTAYFLQHRLASQLPDLVGQLRAAGVTVSVDPNWDPDGDWDSGLRSLLGSIDILFPNAAEARAIVDEPDARVAALKLASDGTLRGCARINPAMSGPCSSTRRGTRGG
jgi:sugar/nucleoside kinase (ribokinase family)